MSESDRRAQLTVISEGPLLVRGEIRLISSDGEVFWEGNQAALCRCGLSDNKPFCDGRHRAGFPDDAQIARFRASENEAVQQVDIKTAANGPLMAKGPFVVECDGETLVCERTSLCRCGASREMPRCDGSHKSSGFCTS